MCGIAGIINKERSNPVSEELIKSITDTLVHRGPDDSGIIVYDNMAFGHRRLSIIDLSGGHQPIFNEDRSLCIIFNGEIYNYQELQADLKNKGHFFSTNSDTEVIVHLYEEYGANCLNMLRGMFAFAIWDKKSRKLFLARDRVGKKPLYYYKGRNVFVFASEIKAILKSGLVKSTVNTGVLDFYLSLGYTPGPDTIFGDIHKLEPAHYLILEENGVLLIKEYWDLLGMPVKQINFPEACSTLDRLLCESVEMRLISEVPLGVFLSGGLDSSIIVALMSKISKKPIQTFSVGYKDSPALSELAYAKTISKKFRTDHHEFFLTPDDLFESIDTLLEHTEEPIVESAGIALYKLSKLAKPYATVLLSGEGSDEIFAGYKLYSKMLSIEKLRYYLRFVPPKVVKPILSLLSGTEKNDKYIEWLLTPFSKRYKSVSYDLIEKTKNRMYTSNLKNDVDSRLDDYFNKLHERVSDKSLLMKMLYIDTKTWLAEDILTKSDRMTMASSVEMRCPFLDHKLIEFGAGLPDDYKLRGEVGKYILKKIMRNVLPAQIINRRKMGFPVPLSSWFRGSLFEKSKLILLEDRTLARGYFKREYLENLFVNIRKNEDLGKRIFSLLTLELWHRKYIDKG